MCDIGTAAAKGPKEITCRLSLLLIDVEQL